mgnify:CR=1 FL=1
MTNKQIIKLVENIELQLKSLVKEKELKLIELKYIRESCPHRETKKWTNNDGDGQFTVERCEIFGLQKDCGLTK